MAITIDYSDPTQFVINVPKADMTLIASSPTEIRQLNINDFRQTLNDLMDDEIGIPFPTNHVHTPPLTVAAVTLARVVQILSPYVIEFEDGLYNVNIVGGNSNIADVVVKNQVGVNTANSAGLQDPFALQAAAFGPGEVSISASGSAGTTFPRGTRSFPVDNVSDAIAICEERGIRTIRVLDNFTLGDGDFSDGYNFIGDNPNVLLTLNAAPDVQNCEFRNMTVQGDLDGANTLRECALLNINYFNGFIFQCGLGGTITLSGTATAVILQSFSLIAGSSTPFIDLGGVQTTPLVIRDWQGGIELINRTGGSAATSVDLSSGTLKFSATITTGDFIVRGLGDVVDNSTGTTTVDDRTINARLTDLHQFRGLDPANPLLLTDAAQTVNGKTLTVTDDGTTTTVTRT